LVFELTDWSAVTTISVPLRTTTGFGARKPSGPDEAVDAESELGPGCTEFAALELPAEAEFPALLLSVLPVKADPESAEFVAFLHPNKLSAQTTRRHWIRALGFMLVLRNSAGW
jgi:hypothetical protein